MVIIDLHQRRQPKSRRDTWRASLWQSPPGGSNAAFMVEGERGIYCSSKVGLIREKGGAGLWLVAVASTPPAPTTVRDRIHGRSQHRHWFPASPSWRHPYVQHEREGLLYIFNWRMGEESREDLGGEKWKVERSWTVTNSLAIVQSDRKRDPEIPQSNTTLPLLSSKVLIVEQIHANIVEAKTHHNISEYTTAKWSFQLVVPINLTQVSYRSYFSPYLLAL